MSNFPSLDNPPFQDTTHGWIQWKGTDVCMDVYCDCGSQFHIDHDFAYYVKCLACGTIYEVGGHVKLYKIDFVPDTCVQINYEQMIDED